MTRSNDSTWDVSCGCQFPDVLYEKAAFAVLGYDEVGEGACFGFEQMVGSGALMGRHAVPDAFGKAGGQYGGRGTLASDHGARELP